DRGYTLARPLGLLLVGWLFWLLGSLGFVLNNAGGVAAATLIVLAAGTLWQRRAGLQELWGWLRANLRLVLVSEALFLIAFAALAWVRAHNPDIHGTEKPMEYMFINAILRSPTFPPNDAWLSGHAISYYYFGYVLTVALIHVTGTLSSVAFNLMIALVFALACTAVYGVMLNLMTLAESGERGAWRETQHTPRTTLSALLAPLLIVIAGNWYGPLAIAHANGALGDVQVPAVYYDFGQIADANNPAIVAREPGIKAGLVDLYAWLDLKQINQKPVQTGGTTWALGNWFFGARVVHDRDLMGNEVEAITEVPAFSFLLGDLHPHLLNLPFVLLAIALGLTWLLAGLEGQPEAWFAATFARGGPADLAHFALTAIVLGGLSFMNTWDFPIYAFVVIGALVIGLGLRHGLLGLWALRSRLALFAVALGTLSVLAYLPFYFTFQNQAGGLLPNLIYPTRFQQHAVLFAHVLLALVPALGWLAWQGRAVIDRRAALWAGLGPLGLLVLFALGLSGAAFLNPEINAFVTRSVAPYTLEQASRLLLLRRAVDSFASILPALIVALAGGLIVGLWRRRDPDTPAVELPEALRPTVVPFVLLLALAGAGLVLVPEWLYLRDYFGSRMNTIFKFYYQAWVLWGVAGVFGLWWVVRQARGVFATILSGGVALGTAASLLFTSGMMIAYYGIGSPSARPLSLDGAAFLGTILPDDYAAIQWLRANVTGQPVIAEAPGVPYQVSTSRMSMGTGLPTVLGWVGHEEQWRGSYFARVSGRRDDLRRLYTTRDATEALEILRAYDIQYVIVGSDEYAQYEFARSGSAPQVRKFEQFMQPVFQSGLTTIYMRVESPTTP
ncbi:MAG TPA: DUF2298 domain-containing protein, partial [Anaerolineales bacterium]|nr:DUF2298 domain-containing protein [Anaerolineales bacterium]